MLYLRLSDVMKKRLYIVSSVRIFSKMRQELAQLIQSHPVCIFKFQSGVGEKLLMKTPWESIM